MLLKIFESVKGELYIVHVPEYQFGNFKFINILNFEYFEFNKIRRCMVKIITPPTILTALFCIIYKFFIYELNVDSHKHKKTTTKN